MGKISHILAFAMVATCALAIMPRQTAPDFTAQAVMPDLSFKDIRLSDFKGKYVILMFYPLDLPMSAQQKSLAMPTKPRNSVKSELKYLRFQLTLTSHIWHGGKLLEIRGD